MEEAALRGLRVEILRSASRPLYEPYAGEAYEAFEMAARELPALGSVAHGVLHHAHCPVLIAR